MKIIPFKGIYPNTKLVQDSDAFFSTARSDYKHYFINGFFQEAATPALYVLEISKGKEIHTGIIACLDIKDYTKGKIVKHEDTLAASEQEMINLLLQRDSMIKPVLVSHPPVKKIANEILKIKKNKRAFLSMKTAVNGIRYKLFQLQEGQYERLVELYDKEVKKVYIADGHHRCSATEKLNQIQGNNKEYNLILTALFPFNELQIHDYNRIAQLPYDMKPTKFLVELSKVANLESLASAAKPNKKHDITICLNNEWYVMSWKPEILKKYKKSAAILDAEVLDIEVLDKILGIQDVRTDSRVSYVSGVLGTERVEEKARASSFLIGFCVYPVRFEELVTISDSKGTLPPKSTWFEPRMINGLIAKSF